jgi:Rod binding domain-containing protein
MDAGSITGPVDGALIARLGAADTDTQFRAGSSPREAAQKFEALFATLLVKEMRKALPDGFFGSEADGDIYAGWLDQHLGQAIAKRGDLHLAPMVERSLEHEIASDGGGA